MPLYGYVCGCGARFEGWAGIDRSGEPAPCPSCGGPAPRAFSAPRVRGDYPGYECPVTGSWIDGRAAHRENLKRTNSRVFETGEREGMLRRKAADEAAFDKSIEDTAEQLYEALPSGKKETLANELAHGVDATVTRSSPNVG